MTVRLITTTTTVTALALAAALLGACGGSHDAGSGAATGYCDQLKADKPYFQSMQGDEPDLTRLEAASSRMHSLADAAPAEVAGAWATLDDAVTTMEDAFHEAGIDASDLAAMQDGRVPAGVDVDELAAMAPKMQALSGPELEDAAARIAEHARTACGIDLPAT